MKFRTLTIMTILLMLASSSAYAAATVEECTAAYEKFKELGNVPELLSETYGYAVLPTIGKGGIGIGGAGGTGCVFEGGKHTGNISMGAGYHWLSAGRTSLQPADPVQEFRCLQ